MTLIEVLVSALIMVIGGASMLMSFVYCHRAILESTNRYNSSLIINEHLEELARRESEADITDYIAKWNKAEFVKEISAGSKKTYTLLLQETAVVEPTTLTNLWWITATVLWESVEGQRSYSMSIFTNEPG